MSLKKLAPAIVLIGIPLLVLKTDIFKVSALKISMYNLNCVTASQLQSESGLLNSFIFMVNQDKIKQDLKNKFSCIKDVSTTINFPKEVAMNITGRTPLAKVSSYKVHPDLLKVLEATPSSQSALIDWSLPQDNQDNRSFIDEEGVVFDGTSDSNLPTLFLASNQINTNLAENLRDIFSKHKDIVSDSLKIKALPNYLLFITQPKLIFSLEKDILRQTTSLQLILEKAKIDQRNVDSVDLRFDKPIVVYQQKAEKL